jgi:hypothetical protein
MAKKNRARTVDSITDCACVIHGTGYDWQYVEKLYNMLSRNLPNGIRFSCVHRSHKTCARSHDKTCTARMARHCRTQTRVVVQDAVVQS